MCNRFTDMSPLHPVELTFKYVFRGRGVIGRLLTEDERWALIEYMKSIPNQPKQITPFGGSKNPIRAWQDKTYHVKNPGTYNGPPQLAPGPE